MCGLAFIVRRRRRHGGHGASVVVPTVTPPAAAVMLTVPTAPSQDGDDGDVLLQRAVQRRGPDAWAQVNLTVAGAEEGLNDEAVCDLSLAASVLHLRGLAIAAQPVCLEGRRGAVYFAWNGELFATAAATGATADTSDTRYVAALVGAAVDAAPTAADVPGAVRDVLEPLCGPYAIVAVIPWAGVALVARDPLGRRSLVVGAASPSSQLRIASVATSSADVELPITGVWAAPLWCAAHGDDHVWPLWLATPWARRHVEHPLVRPHPSVTGVLDSSLRPILSGAPVTPACIASSSFCSVALASWPRPEAAEMDNAAERLGELIGRVGYTASAEVDTDAAEGAAFLGVLAASVWRRVRASTLGACPTSPAVMVLFSGGIDSVLLALLTGIVAPPGVAVELVNVAFGDAAEAPDRQSCLLALAEVTRAVPDRQFRLVFADISGDELQRLQPAILQCTHPCSSVMDHNIGAALWFAVRGVGTLVPPQAAAAAAGVESRLVRFGGGPVLSAEDHADAAATGDPFDALVDALVREGGQPEPGLLLSDLGKEFAETVGAILAATGARRLKDALELPAARARLRVTKALEEPSPAGERTPGTKIGRAATVHRVHLTRADDLSLAACAAAAKAEFAVLATGSTVPGGQPYTCHSKVVIMGMGADETLGGYVRHAKHFAISGTEGLVRELSRDFTRLWQRNLGRDDRVAADHGREGRFPFLDEDVLRFVSTAASVTQVCDLGRPAGVGDKMLLRTAARYAGLVSISRLVKRAVQFGTRIADRRTRGEASLEAAGDGAVNPKLLKRPLQPTATAPALADNRGDS
jgi:asparagine synthetase B (glutamine-hydrolysing)